MDRSSRSQMFFTIVVLKKFANFTGKHQCWGLFLIKLQALRPATPTQLIPTQVFFCGIYKILRTLFFTEYFQLLLLHGGSNLHHTSMILWLNESLSFIYIFQWIFYYIAQHFKKDSFVKTIVIRVEKLDSGFLWL